ncbi:kelch motif protein (macronuclear) [Tetrahymena thermophila SB210]|uniref:Kelch motif protein n=1 Tax=Tetrahymena thermophila (strain SB210) TaxID=312017 RepID=Q231P9_TETTS|nr:kelch motif protein [Tetrahymena thermophila SB210]EAR91253.2 kelch motif protein [Tetrahymena thermophila SB210]|eukprot:XP_001011498.2 kelch motif protein [Tetrahymena thermophila SB210]
MIQSTANYYQSQQEQQLNFNQNRSQHQQTQSQLINVQEQYVTPRDIHFTMNQSNSIGQNSYMYGTASQQNANNNAFSQVLTNGQHQHSQSIGTPYAGQSHTQQIQNQSILSIKTQQNKEQQYVYCPTHTNFFITNICAQKECIEPLCPECIVGHNELHMNNKTQSQLQNIQSARQNSISKTESIIKQLNQAKQDILPQLQQSMNDSAKKNMENLNRLKQQILACVENFFKELQNKINDTFKNTKDLSEQLNAVIFQRTDNLQNTLNELQSPLYIKALIETMENPTSFSIEESSYQYLVDQIKENNQIIFSKSTNTEDVLKEVLRKLYSYQKRKKIFKFPTQGNNMLDSRRLSDSVHNSSQKQLKAVTSPLSHRSNIFNQQFTNFQQILSSNSPQKQQSLHLSRQSLVVSPYQKEQINQATKQNEVSQSLKNIKNEYYNQSTQKKDNANFSSNLYARSKTTSLGNENYFSSSSNSNLQNQIGQKQRFTQSTLRTNTLSNFETFNEFNDKSIDLEEIGQTIRQRNLNDKNQSKNESLFKHQSMQKQSNQLSNSIDKGNTKLVLPVSRQQIKEEILDNHKNDFVESFTVEELNGGKDDQQYMNCDIIDDVYDDEPSLKSIYVFVEGTKIYHFISFEEYLNFPKSGFKTDFLSIDFKIPIGHCSISVPNFDLVIITGGIMYEKNKRKSIRDVYKLNKEQNTLEQLSGMLNPRSMHGLVYNEGRVYAIGGCSGYDESSSINKCEYYDLNTSKWVEIADCIYKASGSGLTVFNKKYIFKFGGKEDIVKPVNFIECYDIKKNKWDQVNFNLTIDNNNSLPFFPFVRQINYNQIILLGGQNHSVRMNQSFIINVNQENNKQTPDLQFEKSRSLPSQYDFYQSQSYIYQNELYVLKNASKMSSDDQSIFLIYNGDNWSHA